MVPRTLERWQGPPNINNIKQYEILLSFNVSLLRGCLYGLCRHEKNSVNEDLSLSSKVVPQNFTVHL